MSVFHRRSAGHRPLRVCYVIDNLSPDEQGHIIGGTEGQLLLLLGALDRRVVRPYLCLLDGAGGGRQRLEPQDCPVIRLGLQSLRSVSSLSAAVRFARFLHREQIDVVQTFFSDSTYFAVPVARLSGVPVVVRTRRNLGHALTRGDRVLGRLCNVMTTATIANSQACRESSIAGEHTRPESVAVIPNAIACQPFETIRPLQWPTSNQEPLVVGAIANLRRIKRIDLLLSAIRMLVLRNRNLRLVVGGDGPLRGDLQRLAASLGVDRYVEFLGAVRDVPSVLDKMHICVLCSDAEGMSNALLESMAAGRAVVATAVGGNVEIVEHEVTGLLARPGDAAALAEAIDRLTGDPGMAIRLGASARQRVLQAYRSDRCAERHGQLYASLLENGRLDDESRRTNDRLLAAVPRFSGA
ncbi:MAG: hypothetical protein CMJ58_24545 [Planctomycetaceae bacterium]|nr:hypothetical protein [Planctomycetaceae bacterium]